MTVAIDNLLWASIVTSIVFLMYLFDGIQDWKVPMVEMQTLPEFQTNMAYLKRVGFIHGASNKMGLLVLWVDKL